jgi:hypothetical protein
MLIKAAAAYSTRIYQVRAPSRAAPANVITGMLSARYPFTLF